MCNCIGVSRETAGSGTVSRSAHSIEPLAFSLFRTQRNLRFLLALAVFVFPQAATLC